MGHEVIEGVEMEKVVRSGTILAGEERIGVIGIGRNVKVGAIYGEQTEAFEKDRRLCLFHEQMEQKGKRFREEPPPPLHKSGDRGHIGRAAKVIHEFAGERTAFERENQGYEFFQWEFSVSCKIMAWSTCKEPGYGRNGTDRAIKRLTDTDSLA